MKAWRAATHEPPTWLRGIYAGICLYLFLSAINIMGAGLKTFGEASNWIERLLAAGDNPFIALMGSVLVTAIVQSSSFTTALIITLVAAGQLDMHTAIYAIMGANIGTSVTGVIVSLGNIRIRRQFRRAFTAALLHDVFNLLTVAMLFPLEWITSAFHPERNGLLARLGMWLAEVIGMPEVENPANPIKIITQSVVDLCKASVGMFVEDKATQGTIIAIVGLLLLFTALVLMVKNLKGALLKRVEGLFNTIFFRNDGTSYMVGVISTSLVQSSSITTSLIVPLAGAGVVRLRSVYAFMLGANLGTTITGVIAATAAPMRAVVTVAIVHVSFNLIGTAVWYPLRAVPIGLAGWYGKLASNSKRYAFLFLFGVFVVVPLIGVFMTELLFDH